MNIERRSIKKHLFICCNLKVGKESCGAKDAESLVALIKTKLRDQDLWDDFKVTKSGCLGPCSSGISATLYPDNLLITSLQVSDAEELFELLINENKS
ncbi:MAG: putative metal-binding protein [Bacteriovoracaceae bacterium]|jgi:predicted metal-binding protein